MKALSRSRELSAVNLKMLEAVERLDIRTLYQAGVHPLLLRPFTLLHQISNEDYAGALKGLE